MALKTHFQWKRDNDKNLKGKCFEVDSKTYGTKYKAKVKVENCKPGKTYFAFNLRNGDCYEVDDKSNGENYYIRIKRELCKPKKTIIKIGTFKGRSGCYIVDSATSGELYYQSTNDKECNSANDLFSWKPKNELRGKCFRHTSPLVEGVEEDMIKVKEIKCRPKKTIHLFVKTSHFDGDCYEQDATSSLKYSKRVNTELCKPLNTMFVFYNKKGQCYEVDEETSGGSYVSKVKNKLCKNN